MVKKILLNIRQYASTLLSRILLKFGVASKTVSVEIGTLRHGRLNTKTCFYLYSPPELQHQDMPDDVKEIHQKCRQSFYTGEHFAPLAKTKQPEAIITCIVNEQTSEDKRYHVLSVVTNEYEINQIL